MKAIFIKDCLNIKAQGKSILLVLLVWFVLSYFNGSGLFFSSLSVMYAMMLPITSMSIDEKSHFERYAMTMPVTRTSMALSKYVFGVFCSLILAVLGFAASLIIGDEPAEALLSCAACFCVGLVFMSVLLPLIYKLGVEKARLSMMAIFVVFLIIFAYVLERMGVELDNITDALMVLPLVTLAVMAVSMCISVGIYRRKEF